MGVIVEMLEKPLNLFPHHETFKVLNAAQFDVYLFKYLKPSIQP